MSTPPTASISVSGGSMSFGDRRLWSGLDLQILPGEYFAVLGPNGSGKSTFLRALLGQVPLREGRLEIFGRPVRRGSSRMGYVPQQRAIARETPLRARDLVGLGLSGHRWGPGLTGARRRRVDEALERVGAAEYAAVPVGLLSGGEQQRLRMAQAIVSRPEILLLDEALLSLDLRHQQEISQMVQDYRNESGATVVFVTHEINPIIDHVDRVLYLANGRFTVGTVEEVMRTEVLSRLYGAPVEVLRVHGRYVVVGAGTAEALGEHCHPEAFDGMETR